MPGFHAIVDQEKPLRQLFRILQTGKIPHALLFTGIEGVGKTDAAVRFAMACNCRAFETATEADPCSDDENDARFLAQLPCGGCKSCRKIGSGNHPDVIRVQPHNNQIRIARIRELHHTLAMKPYESGCRFVIIQDAHRMNSEAANSLLKVLEEPPEKTFLILTACHLQDLLPTIASRCQHVRFRPISRAALIAGIKRQGGFSESDAGLLAHLAEGSLSKARELANAGWLARRNWILDLMTAESVANGSATQLAVMLALSEKLARRKETIVDALEVLQTWLRDLLVFSWSPDRVVNQDRTQDLRRIAPQMATDDIISGFEAVQTALDRIDKNANPRLVLDVMLMHVLGLYHEENRRYPV